MAFSGKEEVGKMTEGELYRKIQEKLGKTYYTEDEGYHEYYVKEETDKTIKEVLDEALKTFPLDSDRKYEGKLFTERNVLLSGDRLRWFVKNFGAQICGHCGGLVRIRNPTGKCDHLYYPECCGVCSKK